MTWEQDTSLNGLVTEYSLLCELTGISYMVLDQEPRDVVLVAIKQVRPLLAAGIRDKSIPYPSKADPDLLAVVMRALFEPRG